ncbi:hypothetical protein [Actinacidiphila soli]|uniref:hypothetical protein n=1 Tax=Actinacidiphila soli TaxID=2487275 RepID=UPI000FCC3374|nr:hypothetical protein [Actinacidiphila soli]
MPTGKQATTATLRHTAALAISNAHRDACNEGNSLHPVISVTFAAGHFGGTPRGSPSPAPPPATPTGQPGRHHVPDARPAARVMLVRAGLNPAGADRVRADGPPVRSQRD